MSADLGPGLLTPDDLATYLSIPLHTLDQWRYQGSGPRYLKVGRHARYRIADVQAWLDSVATGGPDDDG